MHLHTYTTNYTQFTVTHLQRSTNFTEAPTSSICPNSSIYWACWRLWLSIFFSLYQLYTTDTHFYMLQQQSTRSLINGRNSFYRIPKFVNFISLIPTAPTSIRVHKLSVTFLRDTYTHMSLNGLERQRLLSIYQESEKEQRKKKFWKKNEERSDQVRGAKRNLYGLRSSVGRNAFSFTFVGEHYLNFK